MEITKMATELIMNIPELDTSQLLQVWYVPAVISILLLLFARRLLGVLFFIFGFFVGYFYLIPLIHSNEHFIKVIEPVLKNRVWIFDIVVALIIGVITHGIFKFAAFVAAASIGGYAGYLLGGYIVNILIEKQILSPNIKEILFYSFIGLIAILFGILFVKKVDDLIVVAILFFSSYLLADLINRMLMKKKSFELDNISFIIILLVIFGIGLYLNFWKFRPNE